MMDYSIILFYSTHYTISGANALEKEKIENKMIPVPRHISSDCGYCIRIRREDKNEVEDIIKKNNIEYDGIEDI